MIINIYKPALQCTSLQRNNTINCQGRKWIVSRIMSSSSNSTVIKKQGNGRILLGTTAAITCSLMAAGYYIQDHVGGTEGLERTLSFYSKAVPQYLKYRYHMVKQSPDEEWEELHTETSEVGLKKILELRGFYIKSGQMVAANIGDAFPKIWQDTMSILQDNCPAKDFHVVKSIVDHEIKHSHIGNSMEDVFLSFDEKPIGAASIGQVHRAVLRTGERVVVKIMYPDVERLFRGDVRTIKMFAKIAQPVHVPGLEAVEKQFQGEFDYRREARQMETIRNNLIQAGFIENGLCMVPSPYLDLCTKRMLVMEELKGEKLAVALTKNVQKVSTHLGITPEQLLSYQKDIKIESSSPSPIPPEVNTNDKANTSLPSQDYEQYIQMLDKYRKMNNWRSFLYNYTIYWWKPGAEWIDYDDISYLPINHAQMIDNLLMIQGHQVLVNGYFNADPHPGNILLLPSTSSTEQPRLGLIDYGQVKLLPKKSRILLCQLMIALADDDKPKIVEVMKKAGYISKYMSDEKIYLYAKVGYDEDSKELTEGMHIQVFIEELERRDPMKQLPEEFLLVFRVSILLRGLAHALNQSRSIAKAWKPIAEKALKDEGIMP